jgi:hypothetical protein
MTGEIINFRRELPTRRLLFTRWSFVKSDTTLLRLTPQKLDLCMGAWPGPGNVFQPAIFLNQLVWRNVRCRIELCYTAIF